MWNRNPREKNRFALNKQSNVKILKGVCMEKSLLSDLRKCDHIRVFGRLDSWKSAWELNDCWNSEFGYSIFFLSHSHLKDAQSPHSLIAACTFGVKFVSASEITFLPRRSLGIIYACLSACVAGEKYDNFPSSSKIRLSGKTRKAWRGGLTLSTIGDPMRLSRPPEKLKAKKMSFLLFSPREKVETQTRKWKADENSRQSNKCRGNGGWKEKWLQRQWGAFLFQFSRFTGNSNNPTMSQKEDGKLSGNIIVWTANLGALNDANGNRGKGNGNESTLIVNTSGGYSDCFQSGIGEIPYATKRKKIVFYFLHRETESV